MRRTNQAHFDFLKMHLAIAAYNQSLGRAAFTIVEAKKRITDTLELIVEYEQFHNRHRILFETTARGRAIIVKPYIDQFFTTLITDTWSYDYALQAIVEHAKVHKQRQGIMPSSANCIARP